jgi:hypothetical protein
MYGLGTIDLLYHSQSLLINLRTILINKIGKGTTVVPAYVRIYCTWYLLVVPPLPH